METSANEKFSVLRKTPLYELHIERNGTMLPWRGQQMPSHYTSILEEHEAVSGNLALFDLGYRALARLEGSDASVIVNRLATLETLDLPVGGLCEVPFVYPDGTLLDLVHIAREEENVWLLSFSNPDSQKTFDWIRREAAGSNCWVSDLSKEYAWIALAGPRAREFLLCGAPLLETLQPERTMEALIAGVASQVVCSHTNLFAIGCRPELMAKIVHSWCVGEDKPQLCGWASYENWRLEKGILRYGYEIKEGVDPFELGLDNKIDFERESFVGRDILAEKQQGGLKNILVHFSLAAARLPRAQLGVYCGEHLVGSVCAGGFSPARNQPIGSAWIKTEDVDFDALQVEIRRQRYDMTIIKPPFA